MILIIGTGYMGTAVMEEFQKHEIAEFHSGIRNPSLDEFISLIQFKCPELVVCCSAFIPKTSVDQCKNHPMESITGNVVFPSLLAAACSEKQVPLVHLSTSCIYDESHEHNEDEAPKRDFQGYCGLYLYEKMVAEQSVRQWEKSYILRLRLPFDNISSPRNYLNKMMAYPQIFDHVNSLTHRGDFAKAALELWRNRSPFGTYHVACEGQISNRDVVAKLMKKCLIKTMPEFIPGNCTGCRLSTKKLSDAGVKLRSVEEAVDDAIENWKA
jgi:dTDP-4-dehydrorhamnose reductase